MRGGWAKLEPHSARASPGYSLPMIAGEKAPDFTLYDHTGQTGRIGPVLGVQSTRYDRRGGRGAYENEAVIRRYRTMARSGTTWVPLLCR